MFRRYCPASPIHGNKDSSSLHTVQIKWFTKAGSANIYDNSTDLSFLTYINCTISEMHGVSLFDLLSTFVFGAVNAITGQKLRSRGWPCPHLDARKIIFPGPNTTVTTSSIVLQHSNMTSQVASPPLELWIRASMLDWLEHEVCVKTSWLRRSAGKCDCSSACRSRRLHACFWLQCG